jgi:serine/threonine protein kinase
MPGYQLTQFLGRGGWGEVWRATRPDGDVAALKFLPCDSPTAASQEIRALQAIRQLDHANLIRIDQIWSMANYVVIAMELADGSLSELLEVYLADLGQALPAEHVCFFLAQAAGALDFLNARQHRVNGQRVAVRHCDVKPSNLLVIDKQLKLADFSLSVQATSPMRNHRRIGTLNFTAPEIFHGLLSDRTDQYSLALSYCQLRGGCLPFPDISAKEAAAKDFARPAPDLAMLSPPERPIIARALENVPQNRWPSCTEMINRLSRSLQPAEVPA